MLKIFFILAFLFSTKVFSSLNADWSENALIPLGENRANIFNLSQDDLEKIKMKGYTHAMEYPVTVTGLLIPYRPLLNFFKQDANDPLKQMLQKISGHLVGFKSEKELYDWLGLPPVNGENATGIYRMPIQATNKKQFSAGAGIVEKFNSEGLTFSCFTCHSNNLFGTTVIGLTNKRVRANKFFHLARMSVPHIPNTLFKISTDANNDELDLFSFTKKNLVSVDATVPKVLGLDTSLAQVGLSLSRRNDDEYATKNPFFEKFPRDNELKRFVADSKPMPWWNLKYKTRWLADGSIVSGNPIYTNFLWNELGRGADLKELEKWMKDNEDTINELTAAVFATEAPRWTDFFSPKTINLESAKKGEHIFNDRCVNCHGEYKKAWNLANANELSDVEKLSTVEVRYHEKTPVKDVGTDPNRYLGTKYFADKLNNLSISKFMKTKLVLQKGYVPPPLAGIWSRYPYFHNNSIPNLCALFTNPENRPRSFVVGPSLNKETDFDKDCVGYPIDEKMPKSWRSDAEARFIAGAPGLSNLGHYKMLLNENGEEALTLADKKDLIEFLKTL